MKTLNIRSNWRKCIFKEIQHIKEGIKLCFSATVVLVCILKCYKALNIIVIIFRTYLLLYIWTKMLPASQDASLKLYKTTFSKKMVPSDCITLYISIAEKGICMADNGGKKERERWDWGILGYIFNIFFWNDFLVKKKTITNIYGESRL